MNDIQKLQALSLFLDEPIYLIKSDDLLPAGNVPEVTQPATILPSAPHNAAALPQPQLVEKPVPVPIPDKKPVSKNKSKLMILFNNEQSPYLKRSEEALLQKILAAIQLTIDDVELVNFNNIRNINYIDLLKEKVLNQLISFGISLTELNLDIRLQKYKVEKIEGISVLLADTLDVLETDMERKKQLWRALQLMFMK